MKKNIALTIFLLPFISLLILGLVAIIKAIPNITLSGAAPYIIFLIWVVAGNYSLKYFGKKYNKAS
jgi:hypothetical protein